ncbi:MAG: hypothetical protein JWM11_7367 [Planctomycetaceae bacterium]|nr:hypothetical protein [Planctomycetaceae bacterium]
MNTERSRKGRGLFYHRDSGGKHEQTLPEYVGWAAHRSIELGVDFDGTPKRIMEMAHTGQVASGDLFLDYGVSGNIMSRPALDLLLQTIKADSRVSHLLIVNRGRFSRPDDPFEAIRMERDLRLLGVTIVYSDQVLVPLKQGQKVDLSEQLMEVVDFHGTGQFRVELAKKMIYSHISLAKQGFSAGGRPPYGFRRWLVDSQRHPVRQLGPGEGVRLAGHHVCWLPGPDEEIAVILRILDHLLIMPAGKIAKLFNAEGVPAPDAGRSRKDHGLIHEVSGLWHTPTITNIARNPLLVAVTSYGLRSMGDQRRHSPDGPRELDVGDWRFDRKPKVVRNPESSIIRAQANFKPLIEPAKQADLIIILNERGKSQRGKPRSREPGRNPLGCRIFDMACSSVMYRCTYQDSFRYRCSLYEQSHGQQCSHNHVDGEIATRFALAAVQQQICAPEARKKLEDRLRKRAEAEADSSGAIQFLKAKEAQFARIDQDLKQTGRNLARAKDDQFKAISEYFDELKSQKEACQKEIAELQKQVRVRVNPEDEVAAMLKFAQNLYQLAEDSSNLPAIGELFTKLNIRMFLRFVPVQKKKRIENKLAGGILTMGAAPPPIDLYSGPTSRLALKLQVRNTAGATPVVDAEPICSGLEDKSLGNVNRDDKI